MVDYTEIKDKDGNLFKILDWIPEMAREYGWTSGLLDESMGEAIEKARRDPKDPWLLRDSLAKARFSYEAWKFCQGIRSPEEIHKDGAYKGKDIIAVRPVDEHGEMSEPRRLKGPDFQKLMKIRGKERRETMMEVVCSTAVNDPVILPLVKERISEQREELEKQIESNGFDEELSRRLERLSDLYESDFEKE